LSLNWDILNSFIDLFNWLINHDGLFDFSLNILDLSLNSIIISDSSLNWDTFISNDLLVFGHLNLKWNLINLFNLFIFNVFLFEWNVLDSAFNWDFFCDNFVLN